MYVFSMDIRNYEGYYQIDENGVVRSVDRFVNGVNGSKRLFKGRVLKPNISPNGYYYVQLSKDGITKTCYIHQLVAETFLERPEGYSEIDHINGNKLDNRLANLRFVSSRKENMSNPFTRGKISNIQKTRFENGCINPKSKKLICTTTGEEFVCIKEFARKYNINYSTIRLKIRQGQREFNGYGIEFV